MLCKVGWFAAGLLNFKKAYFHTPVTKRSMKRLVIHNVDIIVINSVRPLKRHELIFLPPNTCTMLCKVGWFAAPVGCKIHCF